MRQGKKKGAASKKARNAKKKAGAASQRMRLKKAARIAFRKGGED